MRIEHRDRYFRSAAIILIAIGLLRIAATYTTFSEGIDEPIHLATTYRPRIAAARPAPGTRFTHAVFSPLTLRSEPVTTVVEGRETVDGRTKTWPLHEGHEEDRERWSHTEEDA